MHSAASDQPVSATPDCASTSGFQVCVHPAFSFYLNDVATVLDPVAAEIAGLPGAPAAAKEVASVSGGQDVQSGISGNPAVFEFTAEHVGMLFGQFLGIPDPVGWREGFQQGLLDAFLAGPSQPAGSVLPRGRGAAGGRGRAADRRPARRVGDHRSAARERAAGRRAAGRHAAAHRFTALSGTARHAWLAAHLAALRAGTVSLAQIP